MQTLFTAIFHRAPNILTILPSSKPTWGWDNLPQVPIQMKMTEEMRESFRLGKMFKIICSKL